jgi:TolB-like protein
MTTSRSIAIKSKAWLAAALVALAIVAIPGFYHAAEARRRLVVLEFTGPKADSFQEDVVKMLKKSNSIVPLKKWNDAADDLGAKKVNEKNVKKVARRLSVDGVISGRVEKRGSRYILHLQLREGSTGKTVAAPDIVERHDGLSVDGRDTITDELLPIVDDLTPPGADDEDEDDEDDDEEEVRPKGKGKGKGKAKAVSDDDEDEDDDDEADDDRGGRRSGFGGRGKSKMRGGDDEDDDDEAEEDDDGDDDGGRVVAKGKGKGKVKPTGKAKGKGKTRLDDEDDDEGDDDADSDDGDDGDDDDDDGGRRDRVADRGDDDDDDSDDDDDLRDDGDDQDDDVAIGGMVNLTNPRRRAMDIAAGLSFTGRKLSFTTNLQMNRPQGYNGGPVPGLRIAADIYPLAFNAKNKGFKRNLGISILFDRVISISSNLEKMGTTYELPTTEQHLAAGVIYRHPIGKALQIEGSVRYNKRVFRIDRNNPNLVPTDIDIPDTNYSYVDPGVGVKYMMGPKMVLGGGARFLFITNTGRMQEPDQYGGATVTGLDVQAGVDYKVAPKILLRVAGQLATIGYAFAGNGELTNNRDGNAATTDVSGARDTYFGGFASGVYLF